MIPQQQRRRRRRALLPRTAERRLIVARGSGGFGFTIAGQRPCVVSAVAAGGPAERAGLRAGDALVAVDGANVSRATHASVVRLVAAAPGAISLSVALKESPPTDTEDTEPDERARSRRRHPPPRRKPQVMMHHPGCLAAPSTSGVNELIQNLNHSQVTPGHATRLECRAVVGYLGTIETPQATSASAPGNVRSAVRKLRQERRPATPVLLSVLPNVLLLRCPTGQILAQYQRERIIYAGCGSEADRRYFGLVTSAEVLESEASHSCHVFAVDSRMVEHEAHLARAREFQIACTKDAVVERCLEFPSSAEYVVGVIRGMYSLPPDDCASPTLQQISKLAVKGDSPGVGNFSRHNRPIIRISRDRRPCNYDDRRVDGQHFMANSPQPSNHSEITTTSSNSDSGIGFHNDCRNIADRILVVDFASQQPPPSRFRHDMPRRPVGLVGSFDGDGSFLSNTTPVVDGFGGQGRPLNLDEVYLNANDLQPVCHVSPRNEGDNYNYNNIYGNVPLSSRKYNGVLYDQVYTENEGHLYELICPQLDPNLEIDRVTETLNSVEIYDDRTHQPTEYQSNESVENVTVISGGTSKASMDSVSVYSSRSHEETRPSRRKHLQTSLDDMLVLGLRDPPPTHDKDMNNFLHPASVKFKIRKSSKPLNILSKTKHMLTGKDRSKAREARRRALSASAGDVTNTSGAAGGCSVADPFPAAASEPDLRDAQSEQNSPFRRWTTGGGAGSSYRQHDYNIYNKPMRSDASSESGGRKGGGSRGSARPTTGISADATASTSGTGDSMTRWSLGLDQLLADPAGVAAFSKFLAKEFAHENIRFWCSCEKYRFMTDPVRRAEIADEIYARHLRDNAAEPVNVDAAARADVVKKLAEYPPPTDTFLLAQKHIFRVMKFDSYPRFLKSNMHSQCARNELAGINYTFQAVEPKLKKSASNASERRRSGGSSLLPWKLRGGSRDRSADTFNPPPIPTSAVCHIPTRHIIVTQNSPSSTSSSSGVSFAPASILVTTRADITAPKSRGTEPSPATAKTLVSTATNSGNVTSTFASSNSEIQPGASGSISAASSSSAGASIVKSSTMVSLTCSTRCLTETSLVDVVKSSQAAPGQNILCRVILPDGATSVVNVDPQLTVRRMVDRLMKRRNFAFSAYDVLLKDPVSEDAAPVVDLGAPSTVVGGQEVVVERRCVVRIDVGGRVVAVRCRPGRRLSHALRPIVLRYSAIIGPRRTVLLNGHIVHPDTSMELLDGARLQITDDDPNGLPVYNVQHTKDDDPDTDSLNDLAVIKLSDEDIQITTSSSPDSATTSASNTTGPRASTSTSSSLSAVGFISGALPNTGTSPSSFVGPSHSHLSSGGSKTGTNDGTRAGSSSSGLRPSLSHGGATAIGASNGRVRAALRPGPPLHHHPAEFLENLRETQRQRLQNMNETPPSPDSRVPPPLPPKPGRSATFV